MQWMQLFFCICYGSYLRHCDDETQLGGKKSAVNNKSAAVKDYVTLSTISHNDKTKYCSEQQQPGKNPNVKSPFCVFPQQI